ncbi:MAG: DUF4340 domain-containing protein [Planctomycetota bacterium]
MKSQLFKTLTMGIMAGVLSLVAAIFYPWPTPVQKSASVGKPLFEDYDTSSVRTMRISQYDDDKGQLDGIVLRRRGQKWVIPSQKEYLANNVAQFTASANSLNERVVLEERTENVSDHLEYGVVDPADFRKSNDPSALGQKIVLEDRQKRTIASLIVGRRVDEKNPQETRRFVRIPGQPTVYVCEFDIRSMNTDFRAWVDPNLFQLDTTTPFNKIQIEDYRLDPKTLQYTQKNYRVDLRINDELRNFGIKTLEVEGTLGTWQPAQFTRQMSVPFQTLLPQQLPNVQFSEVERKSSELAELFRNQSADANAITLNKLNALGFKYQGFKNDAYQFDSAGGEITVETKDGVRVTMYVGGISANSAKTEILQVSRYAIMVAGLDESVVDMPTRPKLSGNPEEAEKQNKAYLREVEARKNQLKTAAIRASEFNQQFADWIYIIPENIIANLRPELDLTNVQLASNPESRSGGNNPAGDKTSDQKTVDQAPNKTAEKSEGKDSESNSDSKGEDGTEKSEPESKSDD